MNNIAYWLLGGVYLAGLSLAIYAITHKDKE